MKLPFKAFVIAITGDFGQNRSFEKMRQWIQVNGGTFSYDVTSDVTHLICSKEHFKKNTGFVKAARKFQNVKLVSFDWLEDSLIKMRPCKEIDYLMSRNRRAQKEIKRRKKAVRAQNIQKGLEIFEKQCKDFEDEMYSRAVPLNACQKKLCLLIRCRRFYTLDNYHIYRDHTNYPYDITLARADLLTNKNERYMLKLYESHGTPKLYACFERYSKPGLASTTSIVAPIGSSFDVAFDHFKKFFTLKTRKEWDDRLSKTVQSKDDYVYVLPKEEEPKGVMLNDAVVEVGAVKRSMDIIDQGL